VPSKTEKDHKELVEDMLKEISQEKEISKNY